MKKTAIFVVISIGILFIAVSALIAISISIDNLNLSPRSEHTFNLEESEGAWEMLWERTDIHISPTAPGTPIIAAMNTICYIAPQETGLFRPDLLHCVDIHTGKQKWTSQENSGSDIATDGKQFYVAEGSPPIVVTAYNAENGQKVWHTTVKARTTSSMIAYSGFASVQGSPNKFYIFDASNGELQAKDSVPIMAVSSFANDGNVRFDYGESHIYVYDIQDNSLIWKAYFENTIAHRPVFNNGLIFVRSGQYRGAIHVIDSKTGDLLWEKEGVVGDFGLNDKTLFFMTMQGELLAVDVETGEIQGRLVLDDAELNAQKYEFADFSGYFIRAIDDVVIVYLGDTGQLFSFRYSNE